MRKYLLLLAAFGVLVTALASTASAAIAVGDKLVYRGQTYAQGQGGEFAFDLYKFTGDASQSNPNGNYSWSTTAQRFHTFCGEIGQYIHNGGDAFVTYIDESQNSSGASLTDFGSWVYWGYSTADEGGDKVLEHSDLVALASTDLNAAKAAGATVQWALWKDLDYNPANGGLNETTPPNEALYNSWVEQHAIDSLEGGAWETYLDTHTDPTKIGWLVYDQTKIFKNNVSDLQDQFLFAPASLGEAPEPASLAIWSLVTGLGAVWTLRRRRQNG